MLKLHFNSQPHKEADPAEFMVCIIHFDISTHSLIKRLTSSAWTFCVHYPYFNSQPHKEADRIRLKHLSICYISTHSLIKRLTLDHSVLAHKSDISTHSLIKRLTFLLFSNHPLWNISTHSLIKRLT